MGSNSSRFRPNLVFVGLDGAGKTSIFHKLKDDHDNEKTRTVADNSDATTPTIGYNHRHLLIGKRTVASVWDLGGHPDVRGNWLRYLSKADGIVFVVDSSDPARFGEARVALRRCAEGVMRVPVMVLANKQDKMSAVDARQLARELELEDALAGRRWKIESCSTTTRYGYLTAMKNLKHLLIEERQLAHKGGNVTARSSYG